MIIVVFVAVALVLKLPSIWSAILLFFFFLFPAGSLKTSWTCSRQCLTRFIPLGWSSLGSLGLFKLWVSGFSYQSKCTFNVRKITKYSLGTSWLGGSVCACVIYFTQATAAYAIVCYSLRSKCVHDASDVENLIIFFTCHIISTIVYLSACWAHFYWRHFLIYRVILNNSQLPIALF